LSGWISFRLPLFWHNSTHAPKALTA